MYTSAYVYIDSQWEVISYEQLMSSTVQIRAEKNAYKLISLSFVYYFENSIEYRKTLVLCVYVRTLRGMK
jgi:hypothetical protein